MTQGPAISFDNVSFSYGETQFQFDLTIEAGVITALMGASGSGKSTLLNLIAGFETPAAGRILIDDVDVTLQPPAKRPVSMVFQENNVFGHLSVEKNVGLGISPSLRLTTADKITVEEALRQVGLSGKEKRLPGELSGGERQRVALARVLVRRRPVLLLDEPFASLGPALRDEMITLLLELQREWRMTVVFVTHHPADASRVAKNVVFLEDGKVSETSMATDFFAKLGPNGFQDYIGDTGAAR